MDVSCRPKGDVSWILLKYILLHEVEESQEVAFCFGNRSLGEKCNECQKMIFVNVIVPDGHHAGDR